MSSLGAKAANPGGVGAVGSAADTAASGKTSVKSGSSSVAQNGKWMLDQAAGRILFLADVNDVKVTYTPAAKTVTSAEATAEPEQIVCALRYIEDASSGSGRNVYVRKAVLAPSGETALKNRETEQQHQFTATIQAPPAGWPSISIDDLPLTASG